MAFRYHIDPAEQLALAEKIGVLTGEDLAAGVRILHSDPAWNPAYDVIWDCSYITGLIIVPGDLPKLVRVHQEDSLGRDVLVVTREADYPIMQLYAHLARRKGKLTDVCGSIDEALSVLGRARLSDELESWRRATA